MQTAPKSRRSASAPGRCAANNARSGGRGACRRLPPHRHGHHVRQRGGGRRRDSKASGVAAETFITTKVWRTDLAPADLIRSAEESRARLGVDRIDLLLIHWPNDQIPLKPSIAALNEVHRRGVAGAIGVANFQPACLRRQARPGRAARLRPGRVPPLSRPAGGLAACPTAGMALVSYARSSRRQIVRRAGGHRAGRAARQITGPDLLAAGQVQQAGVVAIRARPRRPGWRSLAVFDWRLSEPRWRRSRRSAATTAGWSTMISPPARTSRFSRPACSNPLFPRGSGRKSVPLLPTFLQPVAIPSGEVGFPHKSRAATGHAHRPGDEEGRGNGGAGPASDLAACRSARRRADLRHASTRLESFARASVRSVIPIQAYELLQDEQEVSILYTIVALPACR